MTERFFAKKLFDGQQWHQNMVMEVADGKVSRLVEFSTSGCTEQQLTRLSEPVVPGFVDVQVNGGGGKLFNQAPSASTLRTMVSGHAQFGTTAMLPTLITDNIDTMRQAADAVCEAIHADQPGILGVHFEGPHLSVPKRGIHPEQQVRPLSDDELNVFCRTDLGHVLLTVAPENVPADVIRELVSKGVKVCLGHSNADADTVLAALDAGADGFTHLYNAMSGLQGRAPGMLGAAFYRDDAYCGLIADYHHVSQLGCQLAFKIKGHKRVMLVTDAMAHVGSDLDDMDYLDTQILRDGTKLTLPDGTLAGSALDMASAVKNAVAMGASLEHALIMASRTPANYLNNKQIGHLRPGANADFITLSDTFNVSQTYISGTLVHNKNN